MKNIKICYWTLVITLSTLWLVTTKPWSGDIDFFVLRSLLVNYTGILAIGVMSVSMMLAVRPVVVESWFGGLDKMYRLHKWLGIKGVTIAVCHLLFAKSAGWLVGLGWLARPVRHRNGSRSGGLSGFFHEQRGLAESIGEWGLYALTVLVLLAIWKQFSYRNFSRSHRLLAIVYLSLVFHSVVLMRFGDWGKVIGPVMAVLLAGGTIAAFFSLFRKVGAWHRATGEIAGITRHMDNRVLRVGVDLTSPWPGHVEGQFAFLTLDQREGPHPFTIATTWNHDGKLSFLIKGIGDYTETLADRLKLGDKVIVEGPYGRFDFSGDKPRQIWIAGGIGIAPFIARMEALAEHPDGIAVDLFYSTSSPDEGFIAEVSDQAKSANVRLHVVIPARDGRLSAERIPNLIPDWKSASFWFCGPAEFGRSLLKTLKSQGLSTDDFHEELFEMR